LATAELKPSGAPAELIQVGGGKKDKGAGKEKKEKAPKEKKEKAAPAPKVRGLRRRRINSSRNASNILC